jgi:hypothetical protein
VTDRPRTDFTSQTPTFIVGRVSPETGLVRKRQAFEIKNLPAQRRLQELGGLGDKADETDIIVHFPHHQPENWSFHDGLDSLTFEIQCGDDVYRAVFGPSVLEALVETIGDRGDLAARYRAVCSWLFENRARLEFTPQD